MSLTDKENYITVSGYAGNRPDYVQGGGGNTSVKLDDKIMAIKASGYSLKEIDNSTGYVTVDYKEIKKYYDNVDLTQKKDYEKESISVNLNSICLTEGIKNIRPSVEVGFHSFLPKYVIHTHSVYANILCCCEEGEGIAGQIFKKSGLNYFLVKYINPGFYLTLEIRESLQKLKKTNGKDPNIILLDNHGIITSNDDHLKAMEIHEKANMLIKDHFSIGDYEKPKIIKTSYGFASNTQYLKETITEKKMDEAYFDSLRLFPDQLVYLGGKMGGAVKIDSSSGSIEYHTNEKEALILEEIMASTMFIINEIKRAGLTLRQMDQAGADFINNWESEKYRIKQIK